MQSTLTRPRITLYNTVSLDGFISNQSGEFDWLAADYSLADFLERCQSSDAIVMGRKAWESYVRNGMTPLRPNNTYVLTSNAVTNDTVSSVSADLPGLVSALQQQGCREVLLIGGTRTNDLFLQHGLIDDRATTVA
jgi:dihydrofolate reductase